MGMRLLAISLTAVVLAGCASATASTSGSASSLASNSSASASHGDLSGKEYAVAVGLARDEIKREKATVTSATATVESGTVTNPNLSGVCDSGRLLHIKLIGTFPTIVTTGHAMSSGTPSEDPTVHGVVLTADAVSGQACLMGVQIGQPSPDAGAVVLDLG
jgi:hypothetical protein